MSYRMNISKKFNFFFLSAFTLLGVSFVFATPTYAAFDPGMVITDAVFTSANTMTEAQIQAFLVSKGSFLANYTVPAPRTVTYYIDSTRTLTTYENTVIGPYGVDSEVNVQGWKASRLIWQASQWYGVNPQVVLTIIEKESNFILGRTSGRADGSIATPGANSYATYAWIMGYAYTEDTSNPAKNVCGTATPGANPTKSCAGIAAQLDNATWAVANWANLANAQSSGNNYNCPSWSGSYRTNYSTRLCDGEWVTPRSGATAALYRYTPHTGLTGGYSGNRAFYLIYNNWFVPFEYSFVSANNPPVVMANGSLYASQIVIRNAGSVSWKSDGSGSANPFRLYVDGDFSAVSGGTGWYGDRRIYLQELAVDSGEDATFNFVFKAPTTPGRYEVKFTPVMEGVTALKYIGMNFVVYTKTNNAQRFYNTDDGVHVITTNEAEALRLSVNPRFRYEGVAFYADIVSGGNVPVNRFYNTINGDRLYSTSEQEKSIILRSKEWRFDGVAFYSYSQKPSPQSPSVSRFYDIKEGLHFFTTNANEIKALKSDPGWRYEGEAFIVT